MKATCTKRFVSFRPYFIIEEGETVDVSIENNNTFVIKCAQMHSTRFFNHFKSGNPKIKLGYSDFEYILCNYVFPDAVFYPADMGNEGYCLIIQDWSNKRICISCNEKEGTIYVSFNHNNWVCYGSYETALEGIRKSIRHKWTY